MRRWTVWTLQSWMKHEPVIDAGVVEGAGTDTDAGELGCAVNVLHAWTRRTISGRVMRFLGLRQKTALMISLSSFDIGRIVCKKLLLLT